jgi:hypothetical protein
MSALRQHSTDSITSKFIYSNVSGLQTFKLNQIIKFAAQNDAEFFLSPRPGSATGIGFQRTHILWHQHRQQDKSVTHEVKAEWLCSRTQICTIGSIL